jgi:phospholipid/cholesterol/gamma-HCH transport system substrate-binding protein
VSDTSSAMRFTNELKVGVLTIVAVVLAIWGILRTDDRPAGAMKGYTLYATFDSAEGVFVTTPIRLAGVDVGSVRKIALDGTRAKLTIEMQGDVKVPTDSYAELKGEGVLGDKFVRLVVGASSEILGPEEPIPTRSGGADLDQLQNKMDLIADDVKAITGVLREQAEDETLNLQIHQTVDNVEALTASLRAMTEANRGEVDAIADNLKEASQSLQKLVDTTSADMDAQMKALQQVTEKLDRAMSDVQSITGNVDSGQGTLGQLVNSTETIDRVNDTVEQVQDVVDSINGLKLQIYYRGDYFFGTDPSEPGFTANPLAGQVRNVVGVRVMPKEDYWYLFELVDHPTGNLTFTDHYYPGTGFEYTEYTRTPDFRITLMFAKRFYNLVARFGIKESGGGVGFDYLMFRDRLQLTLDVYDSKFASWPVLDSTPNLSMYARVMPYPHVFVEAGLENQIFGLRHGFTTGFAGAGFSFDDDDFKWVLATLPFPG